MQDTQALLLIEEKALFETDTKTEETGELDAQTVIDNWIFAMIKM